MSGGRKTAAWVAGTLTLALIASECGGGPAAPAARTQSPQRGGTLVVGSIADADAWNEYVSQQTFAINLLRRIYARLGQEQGDSREHPRRYYSTSIINRTLPDTRRSPTHATRVCLFSSTRVAAAAVDRAS